jgi:uncharacterized protein
MNAPNHDRAIAHVIETIAIGADLRQWDLVRACFAPEAILDYGTPERLTPEAIVGRWQPLLSAFDATEHRILKSDVHVDASTNGITATARATTIFQATHRMSGHPGGDAWVLDGTWEHELVETRDGWKVTRMRMSPRESSGNTALLDTAQLRAADQPIEGTRARNRRTIAQFFARLEAFDLDGFAALFADDGVQVMPYVPEGFPSRVAGREAIKSLYTGAAARFTSMAFVNVTVQDLVDPRRFLVTFDGRIALSSGGRYDNTYISLFVVQDDGRIREYWEYFNPQILQKSL